MTQPTTDAPVPPQAWFNVVHSPEWLADVTQVGPNGVRFDDLHAVIATLAALPVGQVSMYDSINVAALPAGALAYAGYYNGTFANLTALRKRFPNAEIVSVTPNGAKGAMYIDVEPGDANNAAIPAFLKAGGLGFYTSAGNVAAAIATCTAAGIPRSSYRVWSAHWTGRHICGPATCGFPQADGTQYVSTTGWDESVVIAPSFFGGTVTPPSPFPISAGATGAEVVTLQQMLNKWAVSIKLATALKVDGVFGQLTQSAVILAQKHFGNGAPAGVVDSALWKDLQGAPPVVLAFPAPASTSATPWLLMNFSWAIVKDAAGTEAHSYDVEVAVTGKTGTPVASINVVGDNHWPNVKLAYGVDHVWRARGKDSAGRYGAWTAWKPIP